MVECHLWGEKGALGLLFIFSSTMVRQSWWLLGTRACSLVQEEKNWKYKQTVKNKAKKSAKQQWDLESCLPLLLSIKANGGSLVILMFTTKGFIYVSPCLEPCFLLLKCFSPSVTSVGMHFSDLPWRENLKWGVSTASSYHFFGIWHNIHTKVLLFLGCSQPVLW